MPVGGGFTGVPCYDGLRFSQAGDTVYACTTDQGVEIGTVAAQLVTWAAANTGITNLHGNAISLHPVNAGNLLFAAAPVAGQPNLYRTNSNGSSWTGFTVNNLSGPYEIDAVRAQPQVGNMLGSYDPLTSAAVLLVGSTTFSPRPIGNATGTPRAIVGTTATNLYIAVYGESPAGAPATGGIYHSTNNAMTWSNSDVGIDPPDEARIWTLVISPANPQVLYAGTRGPGRLYGTIDGGAMWARKNMGLPTTVGVLAIAVTPQAPAVVYAGTTDGLYKSTDSGDSWALAGFSGRSIRAVAVSPVDTTLVLVGVDDAVGLYKPGP